MLLREISCATPPSPNSLLRQPFGKDSVLCPTIATRENSKIRFTLRLTPLLSRPIVAHLLSKREPFARPRLSSPGKSHHCPPRTPRRPHHFHDHGLRGRRQPAHPLRSRHARLRRALRHLHFRRARHAHHGLVGQLSHRPRARHVPQRLFHLLHR